MRAIAAAVLVFALALPAWGAEPRRATLQLDDRAPLVVKGRGFGTRERVVLTAVAAGARRVVAVRADARGAFKTRFRLRIGRCAQLTVRAVGAGGSRAILQLEPVCDEDDDLRAHRAPDRHSSTRAER